MNRLVSHLLGFLKIERTDAQIALQKLMPGSRYKTSVYARGADNEELAWAMKRANQIMATWELSDYGNFAFDRLVEEIINGRHT
jgi:hypothetical protein